MGNKAKTFARAAKALRVLLCNHGELIDIVAIKIFTESIFAIKTDFDDPESWASPRFFKFLIR